MEEATVGEGGGGVDRRTIVDGVNGESVGYEDSSCRGEVGSYPENLTGYESDTSSAPCDSVKDSSCDSTRSVSSEADPIDWIQRQISVGVNPRELLVALVGPGCPLPADADDILLWRLVLQLMSQPPPRQRVGGVSSLDDVISLIQSSSNIIVLSGAGISVSCGIPDFRSPTGIYARLSQEFPELPDPQAMFDIHYFKDDPRPFFRFAKAIYPGQFSPSPSHRFISALEKRRKLLRNYTQNIDTLEQAAGITRVVHCHGSFSTASCCQCRLKVEADSIREDIFNQKVPVCPRCAGRGKEGVMKPDIVFFGEGLPETFHRQIQSDKDKADLLLVMGSSLKVRPVSLLPSLLPPSVPQVLINLERLHHLTFDVELLGYSDAIVNELCRRLGEDWNMDTADTPAPDPAARVRSVGCVHVFPGAVMSDSDLKSLCSPARGEEEEEKRGTALREGLGCAEGGSLPKRRRLDKE